MIKEPVKRPVRRVPSPSVYFSPLPGLLACSIALASGVATANDDPFGGSDSLWDIPLDELGQVRVTSLATGTETPLDKAAAVATVITEDDIIAMGATDIDQVLETVPGLHVNRSSQAFSPNYTFRGITSQYNPQTLMLINGIPVSSLFVGNRSQTWGGMPVKSIARIEVIRGPGSALYGADAYSGVINIITKSRKDINGTIAGLRAGSFDTKAGWVEHGGSYGNYDVGFSLEYQTTDGWKETVSPDILGASGPVSTGVKSTEMRLDISKGDWILRAGYQGRDDLGVAAGLAQSLDPEGQYDSDRFNIDYTYLFNEIFPKLDIESRISYYHNTQEVATNPTLLPAGVPGFPDGVIGTPGYKEEQARFDLSGLYKGMDNHLIRIGTGGFWGDVYETTEMKNFDLDITQPFPFVPKSSGLTDVSDTSEVFLPEQDRTNYYLFIQDEWQFADDWALTSGVRYDHYSDFGDTTNPRLALVWATTDSVTTKLLYGRAFRAPSFAELFATGNPVALGNQALEPEKIDTYELAFSHQITSDFRYAVNLFYYDIKDYILFVPGVDGIKANNIGNRTGKGGEVELEYTPVQQIQLLGNYSYQKSVDDDTDKDVGESPNHQLYGRMEWKIRSKWLVAPQVNWIGEQKRAANDSRTKAVDDFTTVDLTIRRLKIFDKLDASISVRNIFDEEVFEPSPTGGVPNDFPMARRSAYGEVQYTF